MHWRANGLDYGIPRQVDQWLAAGRAVLVNGSRAYLPEARQRYPDLLAVLVEVKPEVLRQRLLARGGKRRRSGTAPGAQRTLASCSRPVGACAG